MMHMQITVFGVLAKNKVYVFYFLRGNDYV